MEISNTALFENKKNIIRSFLSKPTEKVVCKYHGLGINFFCSNKTFLQELENYLPKEWLEGVVGEYNVYIEDPRAFGFSVEEWSNEHSQDCYTFENNHVVVQRDFTSRIEEDNAFVVCPLEIGDGFFNFLRWFISERLIQKDVFVVHASCVLNKHAEGFLFLGHSGAGKTTITKLAGNRDILGDDMNLLTILNNEVVVYPGAIGGQFLSTIGYERASKIKRIFWLKQADNIEEIVLEASMGTLKLLASFANLHWPTLNQERTEKLISFSEQVVSKIPVSELRFEKDARVWEYIDP